MRDIAALEDQVRKGQGPCAAMREDPAVRETPRKGGRVDRQLIRWRSWALDRQEVLRDQDRGAGQRDRAGYCGTVQSGEIDRFGLRSDCDNGAKRSRTAIIETGRNRRSERRCRNGQGENRGNAGCEWLAAPFIEGRREKPIQTSLPLMTDVAADHSFPRAD